MRIEELSGLFARANRPFLRLGDSHRGALVALDVEGRIYAVLGGEVLHRVNPDAIARDAQVRGYANPGGDGFWPAPEGTCFGYFYSPEGEWRVPEALCRAGYRAVAADRDHVTAEVALELRNSRGLVLPVTFQRRIVVADVPAGLRLDVTDTVRYTGTAALREDEYRLAPWTLSQFDTSSGMEVVFPMPPEGGVTDFYAPSDHRRYAEGDLCHVRTDGGERFQIGLAPEVEWIELHIPSRGLRVRRHACAVVEPFHYIDIADRPPTERPTDFPCRYSIYNDAGDFMEIEAAGPCAPELRPHTELSHRVVTEFSAL